MVDSLRFTADDDLDDFGYEEEQIDVTTEVGEYGPEDEDEDELTRPAPVPVHSTPVPVPAPAAPAGRSSASTKAGEEGRRPGEEGRATASGKEGCSGEEGSRKKGSGQESSSQKSSAKKAAKKAVKKAAVKKAPAEEGEKGPRQEGRRQESEKSPEESQGQEVSSLKSLDWPRLKHVAASQLQFSTFPSLLFLSDHRPAPLEQLQQRFSVFLGRLGPLAAETRGAATLAVTRGHRDELHHLERNLIGVARRRYGV